MGKASQQELYGGGSRVGRRSTEAEDAVMGITYGDYLIDSGYYDITAEQEREIEARE